MLDAHVGRIESTSVVMEEKRSSHKKPIVSSKLEGYRRRKRRDWKSIWVRTAVYDMIVADKISNGETHGAVVGRWAHERMKRGLSEAMSTVFIAPEQTDRVQ